jgi:hypothetical protein
MVGGRLRMELAGLEPATSWVRSSGPIDPGTAWLCLFSARVASPRNVFPNIV